MAVICDMMAVFLLLSYAMLCFVMLVNVETAAAAAAAAAAGATSERMELSVDKMSYKHTHNTTPRDNSTMPVIWKKSLLACGSRAGDSNS
jgi:hypothetical protein